MFSFLFLNIFLVLLRGSWNLILIISFINNELFKINCLVLLKYVYNMYMFVFIYIYVDEDGEIKLVFF